MGNITQRDRYEILALIPAFSRDLTKLNNLRKQPPTTLEIFSKTSRIKMKAQQHQKDKQDIEARMRAVGIKYPPGTAQFFSILEGLRKASIQETEPAVRPHRKAVRRSTATFYGRNNKGGHTKDRVAFSSMRYDLRANQILTVDIDIGAETPARLSAMVKAEIEKARRQAGFVRNRLPLHDDWTIWREHANGKTITQLAREHSGVHNENARSNAQLQSYIVRIQNAIHRIEKKIAALPYPPSRAI